MLKALNWVIKLEFIPWLAFGDIQHLVRYVDSENMLDVGGVDNGSAAGTAVHRKEGLPRSISSSRRYFSPQGLSSLSLGLDRVQLRRPPRLGQR